MSAPFRPLRPAESSSKSAGSTSRRPPSPQDQKDRNKRRVTYNACGPCHRRKSKCDGKRPSCAACTQKGSTCYYDLEPGQTRSDALKAENKALFEENQYFRSLLSVLQQSSHDDVRSFLLDLQLDGTPTTTDPPLSLVYDDASPSSVFDPSPGAVSQNGYDTTFHTDDALQLIPIWQTAQVGIPNASTLDIAIEGFRNLDICQTLFTSSYHALDALQGQNLHLEADMRPVELCAMAAVGARYSSGTASGHLSQALFTAANLILAQDKSKAPLLAMRLCLLLACYTIIDSLAEALSFVAQGIHLGESQGIFFGATTASEALEWSEDQRVLQTLFCTQHWLRACIKYLPTSPLNISRVGIDSLSLDDRARLEIAKLKAVEAVFLHSASAPNGQVDSLSIYFATLKEWHESYGYTLHSGIQSKTLPGQNGTLLLHLTWLNSRMLLYRFIVKHGLHRSVLGVNSPHQGLLYEAEGAAIEAAKILATTLATLQEGQALAISLPLCLFAARMCAAICLHHCFLRKLRDGPIDLLVERNYIDNAFQVLRTFAETGLESLNLLRPHYDILFFARPALEPQPDLWQMDPQLTSPSIAPSLSNFEHIRMLATIINQPFDYVAEVSKYHSETAVSCSPLQALCGLHIDQMWHIESMAMGLQGIQYAMRAPTMSMSSGSTIGGFSSYASG